MMPRLRTDWLAWLLTVGALVALLGPIGLLRELGQPFGGYITFQRATAPHNEIDVNTPIWWGGLINNRAQHGDWLLAVNDLPHDTGARAAYAEAARDGQASAVLQVQREGRETPINILVPVDTFGWAYFFDARMPDLVIGVVLWLAGIIVYLARPDEPANRAFALTAATVGYGRLLYVHSLFFDTTFAVAVELVLATTLAFIGPSIIYFTAHFPTPARLGASGTLVRATFFAGFVAAVAAILSRIEALPINIRVDAEWTGYYLTIALLFLGLSVLFYRLARMLLRSGISRRERRIAIILLAGILLATPAFLSSGANALTLGERSPFYFWLGLDLRYLLLFVPLAFAFVLVRYHAMKAPSPLFIFLIALTSSALVAALSAWSWTLVHPTWPDNGLRPPFLALFAVALLTSLFWSTAVRWRGMLGRNLDWSLYSNASLREFNRRITAGTDEGHTPQIMVEALVTDFELEQAVIWLREPDARRLKLAAQSGAQPTSLPENILLSEAESSCGGGPIRVSETTTPAAEWVDMLRQADGLEVIIPLVSDGELLGVLGLGKRWDEEIYDDRDLETAELVGQQAALILVATRYIQELKRVPGHMAEAQDRERLRLARELHDTVQQFLGRLPFYLAVSRNSISSNPDHAVELLNQAIEDVAEAADAVRQIRHNLAPSQLERGLAQSLVTLTTNFQRRTGIVTSLTLEPELDPATNSETRNAIYRVIEQALNNVEAHAGATVVDVRLTVSEGKVHLLVADNGRGASEEVRAAAQRQGSLGIDSMTARLVSCSGNLSIESVSGDGFEVQGWVPVAAEPPPAELPQSTPSDGQYGISSA